MSPALVKLRGRRGAGVVQWYLFFPMKYKDVYLTYIINELAGNTAIIFASTCNACSRLALLLRNLGFAATPLHGQMSQSKRLGSLNSFKSSKRNLLIATDVASRGLDIPSVCGGPACLPGKVWEGGGSSSPQGISAVGRVLHTRCEGVVVAGHGRSPS